MGFDLDDEPKKETKPTAKATTKAEAKAPAPVEDDSFNLEKIKSFWTEDNELKEKLVCLLYGSDGTAKSGIALDCLTDEDIKAGMRAMVIDLDGGNIPLIIRQHKARCEKLGRKVNDVYLVRNPVAMNVETGDVDYKKTFLNIKEAIFLAKHNHKELNLKFIVYDGLSTALKYAEYQMRVEKHLQTDGGVQLLYWLIRNKIFKEILDQVKALPISSFYIAHEDFILKELSDNSSIKEATNSMMHQKIRCVRIDNKVKGIVEFKATIDKSKYVPESEGSSFTILSVDKNEKTATWETKNLFKSLI